MLRQYHNQTSKSNGIIWSTRTHRVDLDSGEIIPQKHWKEFITIQTLKKTTLNANKTKGYIEYTIKCRRNPQTEIKFNNDEPNNR